MIGTSAVLIYGRGEWQETAAGSRDFDTIPVNWQILVSYIFMVTSANGE